MPTSEETHLANKTLSAGVWSLIGSAAFMLSFVVAALLSGSLTLRGFLEIVNYLIQFAGGIWHLYLIILEVVAVVFVGGCKTGLKIYTAIAIGHQAKKHTALVGIGAFVVANIVESIVIEILTLVFGVPFWLMIMENLSVWESWHVTILYVLVLFVALSVIYFLITRWLLKHKLNLR